jgi:hypothetical protein
MGTSGDISGALPKLIQGSPTASRRLPKDDKATLARSSRPAPCIAAWPSLS